MDDPSKTRQESLHESASPKQRTADLERSKLALTPAGESIRASEAKYRRLFESATIGIFQSSATGKIITANPEFAHMFGYESPEDVIVSVKDVATDMYVDPQRRSGIVRLMMENPNLRSFENIYRRKDGSTFTGNLHIWPVQDADGRLLTIEGFVEDISERKRTEETLGLITDNMSDMIRVTDLQGATLYSSPAHTKILGYKSEDPAYKSAFNIVHPDDVERCLKAFTDGFASKEPVKIEYRVKHAYGHYLWLESIGDMIRDDQGKAKAIIMTSRDISERKAAEEKYRSIFDNAMEGIFQTTIDGRFLSANQALAHIFGYESPEELMSSVTNVGRQLYVNPETRQAHMRLIDEAGKVKRFETQGFRKDGSIFWASINTRLVRDNAGNPKHYEGFLVEFTEQKRMKEDLLRTHKLESLGVLAGGIAHDFNNLMMAVEGYMDLALLGLDPDSKACRYLDSAQQCIDQTGELTSRLITFSKGGFPLRKSCDVEELVRDSVHSTVKGAHVNATFDFADDLWPAEIDELQMRQCFYNLTTNAVEAMPQGGKLTVRTENVEIHEGAAYPVKEGSYVKITFTDEGFGITEEHLDKVFDPYFSTKGMGAQKGMGLGLSVCYSVLKKHEGYILVDSKPGKGTAVNLYLPVRVAHQQAKEKEVKKALATDTMRILIMDDERSIREIERAYLERLGYDVTDAKDGQEAIAIYTRTLHNGRPFDLVILDLTVRQGLGGQLTMERLLKIDPKIKAIIASGYVNDPVIEHYSNYGFHGAMKKPFKGEELKLLVEKILREETQRENID
ncbi:MAG: PAS domain S-box protein [Deltaproteobacteria bacterium]|nr:PAS domain S-box protein [Deltaproteobacteria bacterium]